MKHVFVSLTILSLALSLAACGKTTHTPDSIANSSKEQLLAKTKSGQPCGCKDHDAHQPAKSPAKSIDANYSVDRLTCAGQEVDFGSKNLGMSFQFKGNTAEFILGELNSVTRIPDLADVTSFEMAYDNGQMTLTPTHRSWMKNGKEEPGAKEGFKNPQVRSVTENTDGSLTLINSDTNDNVCLALNHVGPSEMHLVKE